MELFVRPQANAVKMVNNLRSRGSRCCVHESRTFEALRVRRLRNELSSKLCILRALLVMLLCNFCPLFSHFPLLSFSRATLIFLVETFFLLLISFLPVDLLPLPLVTFLVLAFSSIWAETEARKLSRSSSERPCAWNISVNGALPNWSIVLPQAQNRVKCHRPFCDALLKWTLRCHEGLTRK